MIEGTNTFKEVEEEEKTIFCVKARIKVTLVCNSKSRFLHKLGY